MRGLRNAYKILFGRPEVKRSLRKPRHKREDNIKMDLRERVWEVVEWIHLTQHGYQFLPPVNTLMNLRVLKNGGSFLPSQ
jgi:hypothetical protein